GSLRGPVVARPSDPNSVLVFNGHRYRGELLIAPSGGGLIVVNRISIEQYLRGVVPLEIGVDRTPFESAAVEAQAIAARSYTYTRLGGSHPYDMTATVTDQMYGGVDAERPVADEAVEATHNMVLMYAGRIATAPYHANSGGTTAAASEVWRTGDEPYLVSVSDRIPGTDRFYCQESPKFNWTRTLDRASLGAVLARYLPQYGGAPRSGVGTVRSVVETGHTQSGRVAGLTFVTDRGRFTVRGNDIRFVLRSPGGEVLPSTLFSFDASTDRDGRIAQLTIRGTGNGHGVGMDQWGAISRARAGQSYVTILQTYYPGTNIGPVL
ncbi:MAG: SpoIID/LytB domain-containing protein, partial [Gemmatimonadaceae bacterium]